MRCYGGTRGQRESACPVGATRRTLSSRNMTRILVVADVPWVRNEVHAVLTAPDFELVDLADPTQAAAETMAQDVDAAVVDLQVGSMGGMAVTREIRSQLILKGKPPVPVVLLLDRAADGFLARRAGAAAWLTKPFSAYEIRTALDTAFSAGAVSADEE